MSDDRESIEAFEDALGFVRAMRPPMSLAEIAQCYAEREIRERRRAAHQRLALRRALEAAVALDEPLREPVEVAAARASLGIGRWYLHTVLACRPGKRPYPHEAESVHRAWKRLRREIERRCGGRSAADFPSMKRSNHG